MKVAIVHYWLVGMRGGEKVVEALCELFPDADIFTHVYDPDAVSDVIRRHDVRTTFIDRLPGARKWYPKYLPLMPMALEQLDLRGYDLVISSESGPAKGVVVPPEAAHICYCHSPMRYLWDMYPDYLASAGLLTRWFMRPLFHYLRMWDVTTAARVDRFFTNSAYVGRRVKRYYGRDSEVLPPPVDTGGFQPRDDRGDFYLVVAQLVPYKRTDLAVEAFNQSGKRLVVIGDGAQYDELAKIAGRNVELLGFQPPEVLREYYARCRALIFPGLEDFGIVPLEAMASGRPVIAYGAGGALETVVDGVTGLFFEQQTPDALVAAVQRFEEIEDSFSTDRLVERAAAFHRDRFKNRMAEQLDRVMQEHRSTIGRPGSREVPEDLAGRPI